MGPRLLTRALASVESKGMAPSCPATSVDCTTLLPRGDFYPVRWQHAALILNTSISEEMSDMLLEDSYTLHAPRLCGSKSLFASRFGTT